ncbi:dysbindin-like protein, partial [Leptotrombidium deliense]
VKVDLNAGADLLNHYQKHWQKLHKQSEDNSKLAEHVSYTASAIQDCVLRKQVAVNEFLNLLSSIPSIEETISSVCSDLKVLEKSIKLVEQRLNEVEASKEDENLEKVKLNRQYDVAMYKEQKSAEFEEFRVQLAIKHTEKVKHFEKQQRAKCKERQLAFQAAFEEEVNNYRVYGKIDKKPAASVAEKCLEEIQLESDESELQALNEFLSE